LIIEVAANVSGRTFAGRCFTLILIYLVEEQGHKKNSPPFMIPGEEYRFADKTDDVGS